MIKAENMGFEYVKGKYVFKNHSFNLLKGQIMAILGPNGRGKTTLLKCLIGLLPLSEGCIHMKESYGYVPQQAATIFSYSVLEMIVMGRTRHISFFSSPRQSDYKKAELIMEQMNLQSFRDRSFLELSGGERQLVLIARALASECQILVLDEPTSSLDFKNQNIVLRTLRNLGRNRDITIVFTTHSPQHAAHLADNVLLMYSAEKYQYGPIGKVMTDDYLNQLYGMEIRSLSYEHSSGSARAIIPVFG